MEVNGGVVVEEKGAPPPPSPLTGCYLLVVVGEPHTEEHKDIILQRIAKGLLSWDVNDCLVNLEKELSIITEQGLEGEEARYGERLIQFASENLVTEILIHPAVSTLSQCVRNLLSSFTRHRHIIHAGYTFQGNGSWALQDGTFSYTDFSEAFQEIEVQRVIHAYENGISIHLHCSPEGEWTRMPKESFAKACKVRVNPTDVLTTGSPAISNFVKYLSPFLLPTTLETILESSDVVGNIRFSRPTLYVFPGGQGDAALFGINGFNMLLDGGYSRKACFWDFVRHLDRLDAVLVSRLNNSSVSGISSVLQRKKQGAVYPQIGHFFCNIQERKSLLSPDGDKDKDPLIISLLEEGQSIVQDLKHLSLSPQTCYRENEPVILYHKVGHGTLNMYVLSPDKHSREVREFLQKWNQSDPKLFASSRSGKEFSFPLQNLVSICALLVWQPANPNDTITRILYPGSTPQRKILEGFDKLKGVECIKHPVCSEKSLAPVRKTRQEIIDRPAPKLISEKKTENKIIQEDVIKNGEINGDIKEKGVKKSDSVESDKDKKIKKEDESRKIEDVGKIGENEEKIKQKPKGVGDSKATKVRSESQKRKPVQDKKGPTTPKKTAENKTNGDIKDKDKKPPSKPSPSATPAKSTKDANNRKVIESKRAPSKKEPVPKPAPTSEPKPKPERKPISRRPKTAKGPPSPIKKMTNGVQKPDSISKRGKLDKEGTTDSSTVSTPSADQESILKKDISKLTPEEIQQLKQRELEELKEEQEAIKEIEAVFRKGEGTVEKTTDPDARKIKDISIDDKLEVEEYLIIEKEEVEHDSLDQEAKEDEMQKLTRDSEESEKQRKLSAEEKEIEAAKEQHKAPSPKVVAPEPEEKKIPISSPEDKAADKKEIAEEEVKDVVESHPEEKISATIESGATTTAPTLPEDERITLDEIKEDNGQVIEEKHVKEETKEKEIPVIQLPPKSLQDSQSKMPPIVGIPIDKQKHIRDIVKTPDEVADLPVHEEADYHDFHADEKKSNDAYTSKEQSKDVKKPEEKDKDETGKALEKTEVKVEIDVKKESSKDNETETKDLASSVTGDADLKEETEKISVLEKAELETKEKPVTDAENFLLKEKLSETVDDEWVVVTKEEEDEVLEAIEDKKEDLKDALKDEKIAEAITEYELNKKEELEEALKDKVVSEFITKDLEREIKSKDLDKEISKELIENEKLKYESSHKDTDSECEVENGYEFDKVDEALQEIEHEKVDIKHLIDEADKKAMEEEAKKGIDKEDNKKETVQEAPDVTSKISSLKESHEDVKDIDNKLQELKKSTAVAAEEPKVPVTKPDDIKTEKSDHVLKENLDKIAEVTDKLEDLKHTVEDTLLKKEEIHIEKSVKAPEHAEEVVLSDSSPEDEQIKILRELDIDKSELGRKSPAEREEDVKKIVVSVAEVLKSEAPLEELQGKLAFTQELRETHITTQDSPIVEREIVGIDEIPPIPEEPAVIEEEIKEIVEKDKKKDLLSDARELIEESSRMISDIKSQTEETVDVKEDKGDGTVHRMLVTASSEDGGEEIEICPPGTITFSRSSESSGRSSPEPSQKTQSQKSSIVETSETCSTIKQVTEKQVEKKDSEKDEVVPEHHHGFFESIKDTFESVKDAVLGTGEEVTEESTKTATDKDDKKPDVEHVKEKISSTIELVDKEDKKPVIEEKHGIFESLSEFGHKIEEGLEKYITEIKDEVSEEFHHIVDKPKDTIKKTEEVKEKVIEETVGVKDTVEKTVQQAVDTAKVALPKSEDISKDSETKGSISKSVNVAIDKIEDVKKHVEEKLSDIKEDIDKDLHTNLFEESKKDIKQEATSKVDDAKKTVSENLDAVIDKSKETEKDFEQKVCDIKEKVVDAPSNLSDELKEAMSEIKEDVSKISEPVLDKTKEVITESKEKVSHKAEAILSQAKDIEEKVLEKVVPSLEQKASDVLTESKNIFQEIKDQSSEFKDGIAKEVHTVLDKSKDVLKASEDKIESGGHKIVDDIKKEVNELVEQSKTKAVDIKEEISKDINVSLEKSKDFVKDAEEFVVQKSGDILSKTEGIKDSLGDTASKLATDIDKKATEEKKVIEQTIDDVKNTFSEKQHDVLKDVETKISEEKEKLKEVSTDLSSDVKEIKEKVGEKIDGIIESAKETISSNIEHLEGKLQDVLSKTDETTKEDISKLEKKIEKESEETLEDIKVLSGQIQDGKLDGDLKPILNETHKLQEEFKELEDVIEKKIKTVDEVEKGKSEDGVTKQQEHELNVVEQAEEFIEKSEKALGSIFTAIGDAAKSVLHDILPEDESTKNEKPADLTNGFKETDSASIAQEIAEIDGIDHKFDKHISQTLESKTIHDLDHQLTKDITAKNGEVKIDEKATKISNGVEDLIKSHEDTPANKSKLLDEFKIEKEIKDEAKLVSQHVEEIGISVEGLAKSSDGKGFDIPKPFEELKVDKEIIKDEERQIEQEVHHIAKDLEEFKVDKNIIKDEERHIDQQVDHVRKSIEDLSKLANEVSFDKCIPSEDFKVDKEIIKEEERAIDQQVDHIRRSIEDLSKISEEVSFDKCKLSEDFKLDEEIIKKEEQQIDQQVDHIRKSIEDLSKLSEEASFEKCKSPDDFKVDKEVIKKEEKQIEEQVDHLRKSFEDLTKLSDDVLFDKCKPVEDYHVDNKILKKEEKQIEAEVEHMGKSLEDLKQLSKEVPFEKCQSLDAFEVDKKVIEEEQRKIDEQTEKLGKSTEDLTKIADEVTFGKYEHIEEFKVDKEIVKQEEKQIEQQVEKIEQEVEDLKKLSHEVSFDKCKAPEDFKVDKEVLQKEEKQIEQQVEKVEKEVEDLKKLSHDIPFDKCKPPEDFKVDKEVLQKEEKQIEQQVEKVGKEVEDLHKLSHDISFDKCKPSEDFKLEKEVLQKEEKQIEQQVEKVEKEVEDLKKLSHDISFDKCKPPEDFKVEKEVLQKEEKQIEQQVEKVEKEVEDLKKLSHDISFDKCKPPEDFTVEKEVLQKEEKQIEQQVEKVEKEIEDLKKLSHDISFNKCKPPEDFKVEKEVLQKEEKLIEQQVEKVEKEVEDLQKLSHDISFDKCKPPEDFKVDKEVLQKEEKQIEQQVEKVEKEVEDLKKLSHDISFDKCKPPEDFKVDKEVLQKEEKQIEQQVEKVEKEVEDLKKLSHDISFDKCKRPEDFKVDKDIVKEEEKQIEERVAHVQQSFNEMSDLAKSISFDTCHIAKDEVIDSNKLSESVAIPKEKDTDEKEKKDVEKEVVEDTKDGEIISDKFDGSIYLETSEHVTTKDKIETKEKDVIAKSDEKPSFKSDVVLEETVISSQPDKSEKESMEKLPKDTLSLAIAPEAKKLSISDVEISIKTETEAPSHRDAIETFLDNERGDYRDICDAKVYVEPAEESSKATTSTPVSKTPQELSGKTTPPTVPVSPISRDAKSPSSKLDSGLSEQTETDDDDLSTKSQVAHSQSDLDELDMKMDPMSMSFYGSLPEVVQETVPATHLYEITQARYRSAVVGFGEEEIKTEEVDMMTASFIGGLPGQSTVQTHHHELEHASPSHLYELTKAKYSKQLLNDDSEDDEVITSSFVTGAQQKPDPMTASVYFDDDSDPIASWGKPLGLPSPAPPNNNEKGTPKKEKKLPAYVTAKNKLNDDKKRAESPSKMRLKKVTPVYVDLTYVPHHGNHYYSYVEFFRKVRARYYVFSGLEPSRQVYDALLEAKQTWEDKDLEVTIIPTYDTDILGYWIAENEELLSRFKIDLSPSASRCTINLQDHETSCSAYRLEF
ncbi:microtubule-associated protein futsch [Sitophilus oryzae]|uniref:Microtubule-associated protein futsch n=1 Tax=Sitophilus oryzae TaxID=7048 RepID=A0A6J2Y1J6_SITOR|nr:microtubule-associated protein futsch [Sitophilus oryzae]